MFVRLSWRRHKARQRWHQKGPKCRSQTGVGAKDQYESGNKEEKVIYLTLIGCSGSRACPVSLLLTFKPEYTHKWRGSQLTGVNSGSKEVTVPLPLTAVCIVTATKKCKHQCAQWRESVCWRALGVLLKHNAVLHSKVSHIRDLRSLRKIIFTIHICRYIV